MKIINETCYFTADLEKLSEKVRDSLSDPDGNLLLAYQQINVWARSLKGRSYDSCEVLRIGYYQPSDDPHRPRRGQYDTEPRFVNLRGNRANRRLGIVKKGKLATSPLHALAQAGAGTLGDSDYLYVPSFVVRELVEVFLNLHEGHRDFFLKREKHPVLDAHWAWVDSFKIRYRQRAKRGSRKEVARARDVAKLDDNMRKLRLLRDEIHSLERQLRTAEEKHTKLYQEIRSERERLNL